MRSLPQRWLLVGFWRGGVVWVVFCCVVHAWLSACQVAWLPAWLPVRTTHTSAVSVGTEPSLLASILIVACPGSLLRCVAFRGAAAAGAGVFVRFALIQFKRPHAPYAHNAHTAHALSPTQDRAARS